MYLVNICINVIHSILGLPPPPLTLVRRICPVELNYPVRSFLGSPEKEVLDNYSLVLDRVRCTLGIRC